MHYKVDYYVMMERLRETASLLDEDIELLEKPINMEIVARKNGREITIPDHILRHPTVTPVGIKDYIESRFKKEEV